MKKIIICFLSLCFLFSFNLPCVAGIRTLYPTGEPIIINTKLDMHTFICFRTAIITASIGNADLFSAITDSMTNKIKITPKRIGACTNLIVFTADGGQYEFWLQETNRNDGIINVEANPDIQIQDIISLVNKRKMTVDPAIKDLIKFYEITQPVCGEFQGLKIYLIRAVTISNLNKVVYWLRIENHSNNVYSLPDEQKNKWEKNEYSIALNSINVKDRLTGWIAIEKNKERLFRNEYTDLYLVLHGNYTDPSIYLTFNCNGKMREVIIQNIPYSKQDFRVFVVEEDKYTSVEIEDYWR